MTNKRYGMTNKRYGMTNKRYGMTNKRHGMIDKTHARLYANRYFALVGGAAGIVAVGVEHLADGTDEVDGAWGCRNAA